MPELGVNTNSFLWITAAVIGMLIFLRWSRHNLRRRLDHIKQYQLPPHQAAPEALSQDVASTPARTDFEMLDGGRDAMSQLDSRIAVLNELLRVAEGHILRLERAVERAEKLVPRDQDA